MVGKDFDVAKNIKMTENLQCQMLAVLSDFFTAMQQNKGGKNGNPGTHGSAPLPDGGAAGHFPRGDGQEGRGKYQTGTFGGRTGRMEKRAA